MQVSTIAENGIRRAVAPAATPQGAGTARTGAAHDRNPAPGDSWSVLVVDDDLQVATVLVRLLRGAGARAVAVATSKAALAELRKRPFDAVICDVILPEVDGTTLYHQVADEFPELAARFVFVTGWARDQRVLRLLEHTSRPVVRKPFELSQLLAVVREAAGLPSGAGPAPRR